MSLKETYGMPVKDTDGDSMLWAGLMVAVGDWRPVVGIKMCQSEDGRLWRAPSRVNNQPENSFSRDMSLGFLLYFLKTQDHEMADKWIGYIRKTGFLFPPAEATDPRYVVTPALWWAMSYVGMKVPLFWRLTRFLWRPYQKIELRLSPKGFQTHLQGVSVLIRTLRDGKRDREMGRMLADKEPSNPFFAWLSGDTERAKKLCESFKQQLATLPPGDGSQWAWERTDSENAWHDSCGWDFLFIDMLCLLDIA